MYLCVPQLIQRIVLHVQGLCLVFILHALYMHTLASRPGLSSLYKLHAHALTITQILGNTDNYVYCQ